MTGFNIAMSRRYKTDNDYESVLPIASYAPWISDKDFNTIYKRIEKYTLVDKYRCYELWQLVEQMSKLNGALIEVGVWKGGTGVLIAQKAKQIGIKDNVYLCDTFKGVVKAGEMDTAYKGGEHADTSVEKVKELINKCKLDNTKIIVGMFPEESGNKIGEQKFRLCHIDVDVYQSSKDTVDWIWSKLVIGGIIVFDDYGFSGCDGVTNYVNEQRDKNDRLIIHNLNGHALIIKIA